jgi:hypothetical protein
LWWWQIGRGEFGVPARSRGGQGGDARAVEDGGGRGASVIAGRAAAREREKERHHEGRGQGRASEGLEPCDSEGGAQLGKESMRGISGLPQTLILERDFWPMRKCPRCFGAAHVAWVEGQDDQIFGRSGSRWAE